MDFNGYLKKLNINKVEHTETFLKEIQHNRSLRKFRPC